LQVFRGTYHGTVVAAKAIFSQSMTAELEEIGREIHMLAALHHPNIITFYGVAKDAVLGAGANPLTQGTMFIVEEFCAAGNLDQFCSASHPKITPSWLARIVQELFAAVRYMHSQGIAHRDLKPANGTYARPTLHLHGIAVLT
jgi:serine/threonine-protein kinase Chk2